MLCTPLLSSFHFRYIVVFIWYALNQNSTVITLTHVHFVFLQAQMGRGEPLVTRVKEAFLEFLEKMAAQVILVLQATKVTGSDRCSVFLFPLNLILVAPPYSTIWSVQTCAGFVGLKGLYGLHGLKGQKGLQGTLGMTTNFQNKFFFVFLFLKCVMYVFFFFGRHFLHTQTRLGFIRRGGA